MNLSPKDILVSVLTLSSHSSQFSSTHTNSSQTSPPSPKAIYAKYSLTLVKANIRLHSASQRILRRTYAINPTPIPQRSSPIPTLKVILLPSPTLGPLDLRRPSVSFTFADPQSFRPSPPSYADSIPNRITTPELVSTGGNYRRISTISHSRF
ncbi:hypothetical protein K443DRAFT_13818 [Laccaria amethystina LaAM-08-1]|uniref:Uncharacterized protein n=1 Tax=Laccaria amethystina LaAM-08-1 TaxID=1095629 RepID=A0A0C9X387_9AGAR|nr:hypothetical protein K443DRAFT_13818 [Laccaria amethystina LaAM-08-1]